MRSHVPTAAEELTNLPPSQMLDQGDQLLRNKGRAAPWQGQVEEWPRLPKPDHTGPDNLRRPAMEGGTPKGHFVLPLRILLRPIRNRVAPGIEPRRCGPGKTDALAARRHPTDRKKRQASASDRRCRCFQSFRCCTHCDWVLLDCRPPTARLPAARCSHAARVPLACHTGATRSTRRIEPDGDDKESESGTKLKVCRARQSNLRIQHVVLDLSTTPGICSSAPKFERECGPHRFRRSRPRLGRAWANLRPRRAATRIASDVVAVEAGQMLADVGPALWSQRCQASRSTSRQTMPAPSMCAGFRSSCPGLARSETNRCVCDLTTR